MRSRHLQVVEEEGRCYSVTVAICIIQGILREVRHRMEEVVEEEVEVWQQRDQTCEINYSIYKPPLPESSTSINDTPIYSHRNICGYPLGHYYPQGGRVERDILQGVLVMV